MKFKLFGNWRFSAVLTKGQFSQCLNPHIGVYVPQQGGYMLRLPPDWRIFHLDWDRKLVTEFFKRREIRKLARFKQYGGIRAWRIPFVASYIVRQKKKAIQNTYVSLGAKTWKFTKPAPLKFQNAVKEQAALEKALEEAAN